MFDSRSLRRATFASALGALLSLSATAQAVCPDTSPADSKCDSPTPNSLFGATNGKNYHDAQQTVWTQDVGTSTNQITEYSRLIDANGYTACDKYFGWRGQMAVQTLEQKILCGKYQFFFEHYGTPGLPDPIGSLNRTFQQYEIQAPQCNGIKNNVFDDEGCNDTGDDLPWNQIQDAETFTIGDGINPNITFSFDKDWGHSGYSDMGATVEVEISTDDPTYSTYGSEDILWSMKDAIDSCDGVDWDTDCEYTGFTPWCNGFGDLCDERVLNVKVEPIQLALGEWGSDGNDQERLVLRRKDGQEAHIRFTDTIADPDFFIRTPWFGDSMETLGYDPNPNPTRVVRDVVKYNGSWYETGVACHPRRKTVNGECLQWCTKTAFNDPVLGQGCRQEASNSNTTPLNPGSKPPTYVADNSDNDPGWPIGLTPTPKWDFEMNSSALTCANCHMSQLPDGRYAVGMAKQNNNYGQLMHGVAGPLMLSIKPLLGLMSNLLGGIDCGGAQQHDVFCDADTENCNTAASYYAAEELDSNRTDLSCLTGLLGEQLGSKTDGLLNMMLGLDLHRELVWNNKSSQFAWAGSSYEGMASDYSKGTCYYTAEGRLIQCGLESPGRGTQWKRDVATRRLSQLQRMYVSTGITSAIVQKDLYMGANLMGDDIYALKNGKKPSQLIPAGNNSVKYCNWDFQWYDPLKTFDSVRSSCHGLRWDVNYWGKFLGGMVGMLGALVGEQGLPLLPMTQQDAFLRFDVGNLDFTTFPMLEDSMSVSPEDYDFNRDGIADCYDNDGNPNTVPAACTGGKPIFSANEQTMTVSKYPSLFNIPDQTKAKDYGMVKGNGDGTAMIALMGAGDTAVTFAQTFPLISNGVDPRYVECDEDGDGNYADNDSNIDVEGDGIMDQLEGRWDAKPWQVQGKCRPIKATFEPLAAYLAGLKTPAPNGTTSVNKAGTGDVNEGRAVFNQNCLSCHNGPSGETSRIFMFGALGNEGVNTSLPFCQPDHMPVDWNETSWPRTPVYNNCIPRYMDASVNQSKYDLAPKVGGLIGTDPQYSRILRPDPNTGDPMKDTKSPINELGVITSGVKGLRMTGLRYNHNLLHHARVKGMEELLCMAGTARDPVACSGGNTYGCNKGRDYSECLFNNMDDKGTAYYNGSSNTCMQNFKPYMGHEFGCSLTQADKDDLIAYLNSL